MAYPGKIFSRKKCISGHLRDILLEQRMNHPLHNQNDSMATGEKQQTLRKRKAIPVSGKYFQNDYVFGDTCLSITMWHRMKTPMNTQAMNRQ
jgi:hypothetical protein